MSASAETPSNNSLLYNALLDGLRRTEPESNGHYLNGTIPPSETFEGGPFQVDDYLSFMLKAARELLDERQLAIREGGPIEGSLALTAADRKAFLSQGLACITVHVQIGETRKDCAVVRPEDIAGDTTIWGSLIHAALEREPELDPTKPIIYDSTQGLLIPDAFTEPHLLALYEHLAEAGV